MYYYYFNCNNYNIHCKYYTYKVITLDRHNRNNKTLNYLANKSFFSLRI